jgi:hypothetical protein
VAKPKEGDKKKGGGDRHGDISGNPAANVRINDYSFYHAFASLQHNNKDRILPSQHP